MVFKGKKSFGEFLAAGEGIATNVLAERLERLESEGVIAKRRDPDKGTKFVYSLTERGIGLVPLLLEMIAWSGRHDPRTPVSKKFLQELENNRDEVTRRTIRDIRNRPYSSRPEGKAARDPTGADRGKRAKALGASRKEDRAAARTRRIGC